MSKKSVPFFIALTTLLGASLACNAIFGGGSTGNAQATANAALTQAASGVGGLQATANAVQTEAASSGSSLKATADAALTQAASDTGDLQATAEAAETEAAAASGDLQATADAAETEAASGGGNPTVEPEATTSDNGTNTTGGPSDVPVMEGQNKILLITDQIVSYQTDADFAAVVKFYKDAMPKNGWKQDNTASVETANASVLQFTKDDRTAQVSVTTEPSSGQTIVLITIA